jgi:hypothetical protein
MNVSLLLCYAKLCLKIAQAQNDAMAVEQWREKVAYWEAVRHIFKVKQQQS